MIKAKVNTIYVLDSVPEDEIKTGYNLYHDVIKGYADHPSNTDFINRYYKVDSRNDFLECLKSIDICSKYSNEGVLLHIESHGSTKGVHFKDDSMLTWNEIKNELICINVTLDNQLFVTMATCYGRYLSKAIDLELKAPFCGFMSSNREIYPQEIEECFYPFFENLIKTRDMIKSYLILEKRNTAFCYADVQSVFNEKMTEFMINFRTKKSLKLNLKRFIEEGYGNSTSPKVDAEYQCFSNLTPEQFEESYKDVEKEFIKKFNKNFLFGKGRNMVRPIEFRKYK